MFKLYKTKPRLCSTQSDFVLSLKNEQTESTSVWFNRLNGEITTGKFRRTIDYDEIQTVFGYIGKFQINSSYPPRLLFIKSAEKIGKLKVKLDEHEIYRIREILILTFTPPSSLTHDDDIECDVLLNDQFNEMKTSNSFSALGSLISGSPVVSSTSSENVTKPGQTVTSKFEKKILIEIYKIFQDNSGSFYFSPTYDLTNTIERQQEQSASNWRLADDRFFWNKFLVKELFDLDDCDRFIMPIIQGFIQIELFDIKQPNIIFEKDNINIKNLVQLKLSLISRRSRYRLGTRFKRRGIDDNGNVANFVETEQIINAYDGHTLSFVQIRGSIPVYWSQPGIKYRPAPRIDKNQAENKVAFKKHFDQIEQTYTNQTRVLLINLVEETGKESLLGNAYIEQVAELNNDKILYVQFDFHEHCKGLKFENVSILRDKLKDILSDQSYCWVDNKGFIYKQKTLLRVNCVDCLDRTNVVQMVMAKYVLENQLQPLGILVPPAELPAEFRKKVWTIWANNGDAISEQYAGTSALKGDYTRTGERNLTGILRDGMNSANRYYLRFRDSFRQMALDVLQGVPAVEEEQIPKTNFLSPTKYEENNDEQAEKEREENVRQLLIDCKKELVGQNEDCFGSWALINYIELSSDANQSQNIDPDVFLLYTNKSIFISNYDDAIESFIDYQKIDLKNIEKLELGPEPVSEKAFFKATPRFHVLRIYYKDETEKKHESNTCFHSFRSSNLRFFNNLVLTTKSNDELTESLRGICHTIQSTSLHFGFDIPFDDVTKLVRKKSKPHSNFVQLSNLSTKMSLEDFKPQNLDSKIKKFGLMIGNKIFRKNPQKVEELNGSDNLIELNDTSEDLLKFDDVKEDILIEIEDTEKSKIKRDKSSSSLNSMVTNVPNNNNRQVQVNNNKNYMPKLSLKQYANRQDKLKDTHEFIIKNSKTNFMFI